MDITNAADTRRNDNVIMTSKRRSDVVLMALMTLLLRHMPVDERIPVHHLDGVGF